ncbi:hypothetical protein MKW94_006545, partial [Papaver nudicaule]|nr:hypothetical protein [Papaver nudicaule]
TNLNGWELMIFLGFNAAISVRISNELGAGRPRAAKFSILVVVISALIIGIFFFALVLALRNMFALPFTTSPEVATAVSLLALIFAFTLLLNSVQPGIWTGMVSGVGLQTIILLIITLKTNWRKEACLSFLLSFFVNYTLSDYSVLFHISEQNKLTDRITVHLMILYTGIVSKF